MPPRSQLHPLRTHRAAAHGFQNYTCAQNLQPAPIGAVVNASSPAYNLSASYPRGEPTNVTLYSRQGQALGSLSVQRDEGEQPHVQQCL